VRRLLLLLVLIAGVLTPAIGTPPAYAGPSNAPVTGLGIRLVDVPTATADDPRARSYIIDHLRPGRTIERRIEVVNDTNASAEVSVYPAAASVDSSGFVGAAGHAQNEASSWTSVTPKDLTLASRARAFVKVTINVPSQAVAGEAYAVVWAQMKTPPRAATGVTQVSRVGIRQYLSIGPGGAPPSDFKIVSLTASRNQQNQPVVEASVRNSGQRALDLSGTLNLSNGPGGLSAGPFAIPVGTTLGIGGTEPVGVTLNQQIPNGPWLAKVTITSGVTTRTTQATITFPDQPGTGSAVPGEAAFPSIWWLAAGGTLALLLLLLLARQLQRRRHQPDPTPGQL